MERPLCACHGEPMTGNGVVPSWRCAVRNRERFRKDYRSRPEFAARERARAAENYRARGRTRRREVEAARKARGVCVRCEGLLLSEVLCWDCLNKMEARQT